MYRINYIDCYEFNIKYYLVKNLKVININKKLFILYD